MMRTLTTTMSVVSRRRIPISEANLCILANLSLSAGINAGGDRHQSASEASLPKIEQEYIFEQAIANLAIYIWYIIDG